MDLSALYRREQNPTMSTSTSLEQDIQIQGAPLPGSETILTLEAIEFITGLHRKFNGRRKELLGLRAERQRRIDAGEFPDFLPATAEVRNGSWTVAPVPKDMQDRRVEITGPVDRKMIINALNSGAKVFMADFEDSNAPSWTNNLGGQVNLRDAVQRTIAFTDPNSGKSYSLGDKPAVLFVRPRGWHLEERGMLVDGEPISGSLFDFGLYLFHNAKTLLANGSGPYFYLPKLESHLEARLWNEVFVYAQDVLGIPQGSIKATVLIETILAAFEMDEILYELREHSAGLNCGRWDYIFSFIKRFSAHPAFLLPDRDQVTMASPFMDAYSRLLIKTCHRRGAHAMGGMAAFIPIKNDPEANAAAIAKVQADKEREVRNGHDGTWVAHPGLVQVAMDIFNTRMPTANQLNVLRSDDVITAADLLAVPQGSISEAGLRKNINVGIQYIESWLNGNGAAAINNLMEDAATAEISRTQVWQWVKHNASTSDGQAITLERVRNLIEEEMEQIAAQVGRERYTLGRYVLAAVLFERLVAAATLEEFLTLPAYDYI
ncbi:MAG: malate synthase A [Flavobacteriales bacterium]